MKYKKNSNFPAPVVILVRPQMAENMGMVARAMMNCGLSELRVVSPKENPKSKKALAASSGAQVILEQAQVFNTIDEAISDVHYMIATTARVREIEKPVYTPDESVKQLKIKIQKGQKVALLFGPERTGLENKDLIYANAFLTIPLNPIHPSLNLAQAVLLVGWVWWQKNMKKELVSKNKTQYAPQKELGLFLNFLQQRLEEKGYFRWPDKKERMIQNMKNIFIKSNLTSKEIRTLYRIFHQLSE